MIYSYVFLVNNYYINMSQMLDQENSLM